MSNLIRYKKGIRKKITNDFRHDEYDCNCSQGHETIIVMDLVECAQAIRSYFNRTGTVNSAHRCEIYNANMKPRGAKNSYHIGGMAIDLVVDGIDPRLVAAKAIELGFRVGFYKNFTHIDTSGRPHFIGKY